MCTDIDLAYLYGGSLEIKLLGKSKKHDFTKFSVFFVKKLLFRRYYQKYITKKYQKYLYLGFS